MDFTLNIYKDLLEALLRQGFVFQPFSEFMQTPESRKIILRHDVDRLPENALETARLEHGLGISASYYFRAVPESWDEAIIQEISGLGHEIGYHYENLSACKGDTNQAWEDFQAKLAKLRALAPVTTICMHGSPMSRINNLDLWKIHDYKALGIIGEPYMDVDYQKVFYITDTGRKWNNETSSVRDKVRSGFDIPVNSAFDIMELAKQGRLPDWVMINVHPHRWFDFGLGWVKELIGQNIKNIAKTILVQMRK